MKRFFVVNIYFVTLFFLFTTAFAAQQNNKPSWQEWIRALRIEAINEGINPNLFDTVFKNMTLSKKHIYLDRTQPETRLTFIKYRKTRCDQYRITLGRREYKKHRTLLNKIGREYGVNPSFITALWGLESSYGRFPGGFSTIRSLATLAYDGRRGAFFKRELIYALHMLNDGHVALKDFKGEWAGATGQTQFLPSSWHHHAVDYNRDGKKDIWKTHSDIFASIANYLKQHGWKSNQPWGIEVIAPYNINKNLITLKREKTVQQWLSLGIRPKPNQRLPHQSMMASLIHPYGGPYFLVFNNFKVIMRWNRSTFYAATVGYLADKLRSSMT